jgi:hypothetical protein
LIREARRREQRGNPIALHEELRMAWIRHLFVGAVVFVALTATAAAADSTTRTPNPGFLLDRGRYLTFDAPGATVGTSPGGINNRGEIVGAYKNPNATG